MQYAALNLAAVHFRFGHNALAAVAIDESVRVAQQRHDHACVTYALSWLKHVDAADEEDYCDTHGPALPGEDDGTIDSGALHRCASRAKDLGLRELEAGWEKGAERSHTFQRLSLYLSRVLQVPRCPYSEVSPELCTSWDPFGDHLSSRSLLKRVDECFS